jgi:hypothetical protein
MVSLVIEDNSVDSHMGRKKEGGEAQSKGDLYQSNDSQNLPIKGGSSCRIAEAVRITDLSPDKAQCCSAPESLPMREQRCILMLH